MITTIKRPTKHEAARAIFGLLERGWELESNLTLITSTGSEKGTYNHTKGRYTSRVGTASSCWMAKLWKDETP